MMNLSKIIFINLKLEEDMKDLNNKEVYGCKFILRFL